MFPRHLCDIPLYGRVWSSCFHHQVFIAIFKVLHIGWGHGNASIDTQQRELRRLAVLHENNVEYNLFFWCHSGRRVKETKLWMNEGAEVPRAATAATESGSMWRRAGKNTNHFHLAASYCLAAESTEIYCRAVAVCESQSNAFIGTLLTDMLSVLGKRSLKVGHVPVLELTSIPSATSVCVNHWSGSILRLRSTWWDELWQTSDKELIEVTKE